MRDQVRNTERRAALQFVGERGDQFLPQVVFWRRQVDQVGVVHNQRPKASALLLGPKLRDILFKQWFAAPLLLVLAENLNRVAAGSLAMAKGLVQPARGRHVRAEFHE